jgi:hypothetical protein
MVLGHETPFSFGNQRWRSIVRRGIVMLAVSSLLCSVTALWFADSAESGGKSSGGGIGLPFEWDVVKGSHATAGVSLVITETSRTRGDACTFVTYQLRAPGFVASEQPVLIARQMDDTYVPTMEVLVDSSAKVYDPKDPTLLHPEDVTVGNYVLGEALDLAFLTPDGSKVAQARVIPFPIEASGSGGCKVSAQAVMKQGRGFAIIGEGFVSGEDVVFRSTRGSKESEKTVRASAEGLVYQVVKFKPDDSGTVTHVLKGKSGAVTLTHSIGKDAVAVQ